METKLLAGYANVQYLPKGLTLCYKKYYSMNLYAYNLDQNLSL